MLPAIRPNPPNYFNMPWYTVITKNDARPYLYFGAASRTMSDGQYVLFKKL